jgi:hypothetical protein
MSEARDAPTIRLAGKDWPIPELAIRQIRIIVPAMVKLRVLDIATISTEQMDSLFEVVLAAIRRAHPEIEREAFFDWPISLSELLAALPVIVTQAGIGLAAGAGDTSAGEASPSIGTR